MADGILEDSSDLTKIVRVPRKKRLNYKEKNI